MDRGATAVLQTEADEPKRAHGHAEEQQVVLLVMLVPAPLREIQGKSFILTPLTMSKLYFFVFADDIFSFPSDCKHFGFSFF